MYICIYLHYNVYIYIYTLSYYRSLSYFYFDYIAVDLKKTTHTHRFARVRWVDQNVTKMSLDELSKENIYNISQRKMVIGALLFPFFCGNLGWAHSRYNLLPFVWEYHILTSYFFKRVSQSSDVLNSTKKDRKPTSFQNNSEKLNLSSAYFLVITIITIYLPRYTLW